MNWILFLLSVCISINPTAFAATAQVNDVVSMGGVTQSSTLTVPSNNPSGFFTLYAGAETVSAGRVFPFYKNGALYQVTSGKTFKINKICVFSPSTSDLFQLLSDTVTFAPNATSGSLTSAIWQTGAAAIYSLSSTASTWVCYDTTFEFTQNRWPGIQISAADAFRFAVLGREI